LKNKDFVDTPIVNEKNNNYDFSGSLFFTLLFI